MKTGEAGKNLIKTSEGFQAKKYYCPANKPTIGYGHVIKPDEGYLNDKTLTKQEADQLLQSDLIQFENGVTSAVKVPLNQNQFDALVSFSFNLGIGNLRASTLLKKLNSGDYSGAQSEFIKWNKAKGQVLAGLTRRRQAEADLFGEA